MPEYDKGDKYLKEIHHVSILESIDEIFDSASSLMTPNAVMYGSTINSMIAGLPIVGDLDIAVSNQEYMTLCQNFSTSVKWLQVDGSKIPERDHSNWRTNKGELSISSSSIPNPYAGARHLPISNLVAFEAVNNARVQLVESRAMTGDLLEDALAVVRKVDFACCGVAVDRYGRMLETIPRAYEDCCERIIRIHEYQARLDPMRLKARMIKYTKRGWGLAVSIDQALENLKQAKAEAAKSKSNPKKKRGNKLPPGYSLRQTVGKGTVIVTNKHLIREVGSRTHVRDILKHFAKTKFGLHLDTKLADDNAFEFWANKKSNSKRMDETMARVIAIDSFEYFLRNNKNIDVGRIKQYEKKEAVAKLYSGAKSSGYGYSVGHYTSTSTSSS